MNDIETQKLIQFNEDVVMKNAVLKILLSYMNMEELIEVKNDYSNSQLGQLLRGYKIGRKIISMGLKDLEQYKREIPETPYQNTAV